MQADLQAIAFGLSTKEDLYLFGSLRRVKKGQYLHVKMEVKEPLRKAFQYFCTKHNLNIEEIVFKLGNREIKATESPADIYLKHSDIINIYNREKLPRSTFSGDMWEMYQRGEYTDVSLEVDGKSFDAHKAVLSARCKKFQAMFRSQMKEGDQKKVVLNSGTASAFSLLLEYLYTDRIKWFADPQGQNREASQHSSSGSIEKSHLVVPDKCTKTQSPEEDDENKSKHSGRVLKIREETIMNLYCLAEEYLLDRLKAICEEQLKKILNPTNAPLVTRRILSRVIVTFIFFTDSLSHGPS